MKTREVFNWHTRRTEKVPSFRFYFITRALAIAILVFLTKTFYEIYIDTVAVANRAQVSATADEMLMYMKQFVAGLEKNQMTEGYAALIFKGPNNDLALQYRAYINIIRRLESVSNMSFSDPAYANTTDDIRGIIRESTCPISGFMFAKYYYFIPIMLCFWYLPNVIKHILNV